MAEFGYTSKIREAVWALRHADYSKREQSIDLRNATIAEFERQLEVIRQMEEFAEQHKNTIIRVKV